MGGVEWVWGEGRGVSMGRGEKGCGQGRQPFGSMFLTVNCCAAAVCDGPQQSVQWKTKAT
jgi:hypothetical protein